MMMAAAGHTVKQTQLDWDLSESEVARLVRDDPRPFALIGRWAGGGALIGSDPTRVATDADDPFALLDEHPMLNENPLLNERPPQKRHPPANEHPPPSHPQPVGGGWVGYLGYGLGRRLEPVSAGPPTPTPLPAFALAYYDHVLRRDPDGRWWFEALWSDAAAARLEARLAELTRRASAPPPARPFTTEPWRATPRRDGHERAVEACRRRIHAGDLFQANVCVRLDSRIDGDPLDMFLAGVEALRPDRAAYLKGPWGAVASLSPELFLERRGDRVRSAPIKGTIRKPADPDAAAHARETLRTSAKDRAENVMIVDLVRNDLGRVCRPGTVTADVVADPRAHTGVWHLVSEVSGELAPDAGNAALVRAAFPPGSVTGAPKVAALGVIAELESTSRHVYTGAIGFASPLAGLELSVAIRTFEFAPDRERTWLGVGGGIVADSDPAAEAAECLTKATPLLDAIGASVERPGDRRRRDLSARLHIPPRHAPQPIPRPDPTAGVFETLLVEHGRPVALDEHLARLARSISELYGLALPADVSARLRAAARITADKPKARLRIDARPDAEPHAASDTARIDLQVSDVPVRREPPTLQPVVVPGGLGAHKWIDRRLLDALGTVPHPLICDLDGAVLETPRANVFVVSPAGTLVTPPTDGRILPGVTRGQVLRTANALGVDTEIRALDITELTHANEVFLTGSLAGVEPALRPAQPSAETPPNVAERLRTNLYKNLAPAILR